jgi:PPOX class probable FMN-dependent enzyme
MTDPYVIDSLEALEALYAPVNPNSLAKETGFLTPEYRQWIEAAPFFALASVGAGGLDCSPRGDRLGQLFEIEDEKTLLLPDRRGNNRIDTLRNIVADPRVALLFLVPGIDETLRINGRATITTDPELLSRFIVAGKTPATVLRLQIDAVYFQCARALTRAELWNAEKFVTRGDVPTAGQMTKAAKADFDAETYDAELRERQKRTLY